jgi:hypothetical protein
VRAEFLAHEAQYAKAEEILKLWAEISWTEDEKTARLRVYNVAMSGPDLETRILNRLQDRSPGQTVEQLSAFLKEIREPVILLALHHLRDLGQITESNGVWKLGRSL